MQQAGLRTHIDILGNVRGRVGSLTGAPALLLGSHYDTVWDAGRYDGTLGIIVALAATKALLLQACLDSSTCTAAAIACSKTKQRNVNLCALCQAGTTALLVEASRTVRSFWQLLT